MQINPLNVEEIGDIQVSGPNVFKGYWNLPDKTSEEFTSDNYFKTGDKGYFDKDGYLFIVGRNKDMIISGGLNVYPKEVETYIDEIDGVNESAVIGLKDDDFGEKVVAIVVLEEKSDLKRGTNHKSVKKNLLLDLKHQRRLYSSMSYQEMQWEKCKRIF